MYEGESQHRLSAMISTMMTTIGTKSFRSFLSPNKLQILMFGTPNVKYPNGIKKANHLALTLYLENELADEAETPLKAAAPVAATPVRNEKDLICWPWTGIVVNIVKEADSELYLIFVDFSLKGCIASAMSSLEEPLGMDKLPSLSTMDLFHRFSSNGCSTSGGDSGIEHCWVEGNTSTSSNDDDEYVYLRFA